MTKPLPRFVVAKSLKNGKMAYYWTLPSYYRQLGCTLHRDADTALGSDYEAACGPDSEGGKAATLNGLFDEWDAQRRGVKIEDRGAAPGTVDWLFRTYKASLAWRRKVSVRSRPDYERTIRLLCDTLDKKGRRIGTHLIRSITPAAADKLYDKVMAGPIGSRPRQAEKVVTNARRAWSVVRRLHPEHFDDVVPNPWVGVEMEARPKITKPAATRDQTYTFAWGCIERGFPEVGAAAVICFEWLQRPENVLAGYVRWSEYRSSEHPTMIRVEHHKTRKMVLHPLEEMQGRDRVLFYAEAEEILSQVPRRGIPIVLRKYRDGTTAPWNGMRVNKVVRKIRADLGLPTTFTLDACRHGGMTELEEAGLTDGQGRALSAHSSRAYEGYAKRTEERALAATRKRHAFLLQASVEVEASANSGGTKFQNDRVNQFQNGGDDDDAAIA
jgi:hypothetical protein